MKSWQVVGCGAAHRAAGRLLGLCLCAGMAVIGSAATASAQCQNFTIAQLTDPPFVAGDTDIGNHGDDVVTTISLPFNWSMYGQSYNSAAVSSNGNVQFGTAVNAWTNNCLSTATFAGPVIFPHWDDQRTDTANSGIYTSVTGASPDQIFTIEWRTTYYADAQPLKYTLRLYEGSARFDVVYASIPNMGVSATIGVQSGNGGPYNEFACNTTSLGGVQGLSFVCPSSGPPACASSVSVASGAVGNTIAVRATVFPGVGPPSTGITASVDASALDGGTVNLFDNGTGGDTTAGDNVYTGLVTVGPNAALGAQTLTTTVQDLQARSSTCSVGFFVDDAGETIANAATRDLSDGFINGTLHLNDADMYRISICEPATFSATTVGGSTVDTQLFVFKNDGTGIVMNDDDPTAGTTHLQSRLGSSFTASLAPGEYFLAISQFDKDPLDAANAQLWLDTVGGSYRVEHAPDDVGASSPMDHWSTAAGTGGAYTITFTGVSSTCGSGCDSADYNNDGDTGTDIDIEAFFACLGGNCCATCPANADFNRDGDTGTDLDIEAFFRVLGGNPC